MLLVGLAGVPAVPAEPGTVSAPGVRNVPEVVGEPGELDAPEVEPVPDELDELGMVLELLEEPDVDPALSASFELVVGLAGVPAVPAEPGTVSAPGVRKVPEVVGEPGALAPLEPVAELPDDVPIDPDVEPALEPVLPDPIAPQAPSTKTAAIGMIHFFIRDSSKN